MAEPVGAVERADAVARVHVVGAAHVLDDLEARSDRDHPGGVLDVTGEPADVAVEVDLDPVVAAHPLFVGDSGAVPGERVLDARDGLIRLLPLADEKAQPQPVVHGASP